MSVKFNFTCVKAGIPYNFVVSHAYILRHSSRVLAQPAQQAFPREFVEKVGTRAKNKKGQGRGRGRGLKEPSTFFFFCSRSNFRAVTRLETLATQASSCPTNVAVGTREEPLRTSSWEASNFADKHIFCSDVFKRNSREKSAALISARFFSCLLIFFYCSIYSDH